MVSVTLVGLSGLEPPTSRLSGVRSNQLSYKPLAFYSVTGNGDGEIRTLDPLLARQVLSQLSYTPRFSVHAKGYEQIYIKYFLFLFNPAAHVNIQYLKWQLFDLLRLFRYDLRI